MSGVVHLMVTDPEADRYSDTFSVCCGYNWWALLDSGDLVAGRREMVTCKGRHGFCCPADDQKAAQA